MNERENADELKPEEINNPSCLTFANFASLRLCVESHATPQSLHRNHLCVESHAIPQCFCIAARSSPLSRVQVKEIIDLVHCHYPDVVFECCYVETTGDKDQKTSLRSLGKTDFFTKEIDALLLAGACRAGIHSAKDLPDPLPTGLKVAALTKGVDPADVLVLNPGHTFSSLPKGAIIATSSVRREEAVKQLRQDFRFVDLRGTIAQRLAKLENKEVHGVVVAEAALIRLGLTHLNRIRLPGETTPFQGQLAVIIREDDDEMERLFSCCDYRHCS